ncbi:MAG: stage II sporulation protein P [Clostridia bacterium]
MNQRIMQAFVLLLLLALLLPLSAAAAQDEVYTIMDAQGTVVTQYCGECEQGDEYIGGDNRHYRVTKVNADEKIAIAEFLGVADMPDVSWLTMQQSLPVSAVGTKKIALYCTHSDESYENGDGATSTEPRGGIYDIKKRLADGFTALGVTVEQSDETHHPHDAGAYRRSRQTAVTLLKTQPSAIFDIHRDGIPNPEEYAVTIGNEKMSKVRLLVGKGNQNKEANLSFAKQIKAVADKIYPKLIKDIYMGKGSYNQDLAPRSVLLEFGTHTLSKERVLKATKPLSEVIYKALYGGVTGSAGASDVSGGAPTAQNPSASAPPADQGASADNTGSTAIIWLIVALVIGLGVFAFLSAGRRGGGSKWGRSFSEMTGGLFGKKPPKDGE